MKNLGALKTWKTWRWKINDLDDYEEDPYDYCYECGGYGDDYYMGEDGELICRCPECPMNPNSWDD